MNSDTAILMIKALDGLSARATVTAENIANVGTAGYRPLRVSFEKALQAAAASGPDDVRAVSLTAQRAALGTPEAELRPDLEMATAMSTSLRYGAVIDVFSRQLLLESIAIKGS